MLDEAAGPVGLRDIASQVDVKWAKIELALKQLDVEGVVRRVKGQSYERTLAAWAYPHERVQSVTDARRFEQQLMFDYAETTGCRMRFLTDLLDDNLGQGCGICDNCRNEFIQPSTSTQLIAAAEAFLRNRPLTGWLRRSPFPTCSLSNAPSIGHHRSKCRTAHIRRPTSQVLSRSASRHSADRFSSSTISSILDGLSTRSGG